MRYSSIFAPLGLAVLSHAMPTLKRYEASGMVPRLFLAVAVSRSPTVRCGDFECRTRT